MTGHLTPRALVRDAAERVRAAYDELHAALRLAAAMGADEGLPEVMRHHVAECERRAAELGAAVAELEALVHRPTARKVGPANPEVF